MNKKCFILPLLLMLLVLSACGTQSTPENELPPVLREQTFLYDELETGEGTALFTLRFLKNRYVLNKSDGAGIIASGAAQAADGTLMLFGSDLVQEASFSGSAFETPAVTLSLNGRTMRFWPAGENAEDVYLSFLGTYTDGDAVFVLERWNEWYLYDGKDLQRGTYEIFEDGTLELQTEKGKTVKGIVQKKEGAFESKQTTFALRLRGKAYAFSYAAPLEQFDAAHAMGTYTLSLYPSNVFEIYGVDGFLKAFGTLKDGTVQYFPRKIAADAESAYSFAVTKNGDTWYFPETTPLLPRSGNISKDTGVAAYWNAGTKLEFMRKTDAVLPAATELFPKQTVAGSSNFPAQTGELKAVMPSIGTAKPLALLIDFPDQHRPRHVTAENVQHALFSLEEAASLAAFYYRSSYGKLTIDGTVLGWYRTKQPRSAYESDSEIMREAIGYYMETEHLNLADYDADGDGTVDALYVLWAGNMQSGTGIWDSAYRSTWRTSPKDWNRKISGYIFVPGSTIWSSVPPLKCNTNSLIHETGHLLGLNDYYSYDTTSRKNEGSAYTGGALEGGLGGMDMMDTNIGDHNIFSKWLLGWAEPVVIEKKDIVKLKDQTYRLNPSATNGDGIFIKLKDEKTMYTELLVVEAVSPELNFAEYSRLTQPVVRVLHVDTSLAKKNNEGGWRGFGFQNDNSYTTTKYISLLEADGKDEVLNFVPSKTGEKLSYEEADYFCAGDALTPDSYPNTNAYDDYGNASVPTGLCIFVDSIEADGTAVVRLSYQPPKASLHLKSMDPLPQIVPYQKGHAQTADAGKTTWTFTFDRQLQWAQADAEKRIHVYSDLQQLEGVTATLNDATLTLSFANGLQPKTGYTAVLPQGILCAADDSGCKNNFNGIYGLLTN